VRLRSYETGLVATRGKGTGCSTMPVGISSAHQTQTRNVKTVRHDQRLHGPHPQHIQSLVLLSVGHTTPHAGISQPRSISDPSMLLSVMQKVALGHRTCRCQHQPSEAPHSSFLCRRRRIILPTNSIVK